MSEDGRTRCHGAEFSPEDRIPEQIRVSRQRDELVVVWPTGRTDRLGACHLRSNTQSAGGKRLRLARLDVPPVPDLTISAVRPVGSYAINIVFSDGHDRGIYPWSFLAALAADTDEAAAGAPSLPARQ